jgi:hypothetical protein
MGTAGRWVRYAVGGALCCCGLALVSGILVPRPAGLEHVRVPFGVVVGLYGLLRIVLTWTHSCQEEEDP